ncbi:gamma-glutamyl hydrolase-like isoform X1 [Hippoglossus hippoglossus]|uniref:gamma-glutamyl hydrolase-like isoform X1 n=1 Tax=Hippoglossus hippoglossus TaxID=8267 RepID=UPI00148E3740|nr:gamma-glutamyl hydrolase-like isoform X1 [Hippoglossus hippoglossus]
MNQPLNSRPIIGVLADETRKDEQATRGYSYIPACYVKYLEAAGARVVPVRLNLPEEEYTKIFNSINGLLLPGGVSNLLTSPNSRTSGIFYNLALRANDASDYFPILGTCQGFQQLTVLTAKEHLLTRTDTKAVALPLNFTPMAHSSRLFQSFPKDVLRSLTEENITPHFHKWSLSSEAFNGNPRLNNFYKALSTNHDGKQEFISTIEAYQYPFYGLQWHPEKTPFEWIDKPGMIHSAAAIRASFYTSSFFVSEARKSSHRFPSQEEEESALIYNFCPVFRGMKSIFIQYYYFD